MFLCRCVCEVTGNPGLAQNDDFAGSGPDTLKGVTAGSSMDSSVSLIAEKSTKPTLAIERLTLTHFRNYATLRLNCGAEPVVLTGPNGAGKTNLLEALSFLAPGRGLRRAKLTDIARHDLEDSDQNGAMVWGVAAHLTTPQGPVELGTGCNGEVTKGGRPRRIVHVDGETVSQQAALAEHVHVQWLTPQMDRLFLDGAQARRRFLDRLVFGFDSAHAGRVAAYEHALRERNRLFRNQGIRSDADWLTALEDTMASKGMAVVAARCEILMRIKPACVEVNSHFPAAEVSLEGTLEKWLEEMPALAAEDQYRSALAASRDKDAETGRAAIGPHRSDLRVRHVGNGRMAELCSTGEQKALLIRLILAHVQTAARDWGRLPILLLDEVAAHLDEKRRTALIEEIMALRIQAWLTGTDETLFEAFKHDAQFFHINAGTVSAGNL